MKVVGMLRKQTTENIEHVFIDGLSKEVTDPVDEAAIHDIEEAVVSCRDSWG